MICSRNKIRICQYSKWRQFSSNTDSNKFKKNSFENEEVYCSDNSFNADANGDANGFFKSQCEYRFSSDVQKSRVQHEKVARSKKGFAHYTFVPFFILITTDAENGKANQARFALNRARKKSIWFPAVASGGSPLIFTLGRKINIFDSIAL